MIKFVTSTGETAYIPSEDEKQAIKLALKVFKANLPHSEEGVVHG